MKYSIFISEAYESDEWVLTDAPLTDVIAFLSTYKGYIDDLTVIEGVILDSSAFVKNNGFSRSLGKIKTK